MRISHVPRRRRWNLRQLKRLRLVHCRTEQTFTSRPRPPPKKNSLREGVDAGLDPVGLDVAPAEPQAFQPRVLAQEAAEPPKPFRSEGVVGQVERLDRSVAQQQSGKPLRQTTFPQNTTRWWYAETNGSRVGEWVNG